MPPELGISVDWILSRVLFPNSIMPKLCFSINVYACSRQLSTHVLAAVLFRTPWEPLAQRLWCAPIMSVCVPTLSIHLESADSIEPANRHERSCSWTAARDANFSSQPNYTLFLLQSLKLRRTFYKLHWSSWGMVARSHLGSSYSHARCFAWGTATQDWL